MTSSLLFNLTTFAYLISMLLFFAFLASRVSTLGLLGSAVAFFGLVVQSVAIGLRWRESYVMGVGHAPLSNLYESVVFFSWTIVLIYLLLDLRYRYRVIGAFVMPFALLGMTWAQLGLASGIEQGQAENYKPVLYVEPRRGTGVKPEEIDAALKDAMVEINKTYPGVGFEKHETGWRINVPAQYAHTHEEHFGQVAEKYLGFLKNRDMPAWEVPNMLVKIHTLMEAYKKSR